MKKLLALIVLFILFAAPVVAKKPENVGKTCTTIQSGELYASDESLITTGFDEWGYNYQAHLFNGYYCDAYRDAAWCQDYKEDNLSMKWNDAWLSNKDCDGDGKLDRHYGYDSYIGSGAWLTNHQSGSYQSEANVTGTWWLNFAGGTHNREFRDLIQDEEGKVTGQFWWLNPAVWEWEYGGTLDGNVTGNILTLYYERPQAYNYNGNFVGTISEAGITEGIFTDSHDNYLFWTATSPDARIYDTCSWNYFVKIVAAPADATLEDDIWYAADGVEIGPAIWGEFATIQEVYNDSCAGEHGLMYKSPVRAGLGNW